MEDIVHVKDDRQYVLRYSFLELPLIHCDSFKAWLEIQVFVHDRSFPELDVDVENSMMFDAIHHEDRPIRLIFGVVGRCNVK